MKALNIEYRQTGDNITNKILYLEQEFISLQVAINSKDTNCHDKSDYNEVKQSLEEIRKK